MTSAPVRDPLADHLITPQNAALLFIDYLRLAGHPVIWSYEPGEDWYWCYRDQSAFELQGAPPAPSHP
jgi:hypothetical protein